MKGRNATQAQKQFWTSLCEHVGCIACLIDGRDNDYVSIHHIKGRTRRNAHWLVLPLCAGHHQDGVGAPGLIAVHPWKTQFEELYGKQLDLLAKCIDMLIDGGYGLPSELLVAAGRGMRTQLANGSGARRVGW